MKNIKPTIDNMTRAELIAELQSKQDEVDGLKKQLGAITHAVVSNLRLTEKLIANVQESLPVLEKESTKFNYGWGWGASASMGILSAEGVPPLEYISDDTGREEVKKQLIMAVMAYMLFLILLTTISIIMANAR